MRAPARFLARPALIGALALAGCGDNTAPTTSPATIVLGAAELRSLDSTAVAIAKANPGNSDLNSVVDSTLLVLSAGVEAKRVDISTNLTSAPLYMIGVHRAVTTTSGSFSTWTLVAIDDPKKLTNLIEVAGFAQSTGSTPPSSVSGGIGTPGNIGNGLLLQVGTGSTVTLWRPNSGSASFSSSAPGAACPNFTPPPRITCALETITVRFTVSATSGTGGATSRQATLSTDTPVPAIRLTYGP